MTYFEVTTKVLLAVALVSVPAAAEAQTCAQIPIMRQQAIDLVTEQTNALRECLIAFPDWRAEAKEQFYDTYKVTETIPGQPRRVIVRSSRNSAVAYTAPATRSRVEHSIEHVDIGKEQRLALLSAEERAALYGDVRVMDAALSDEFMLCRGKADATKLFPALIALGWGWGGPFVGPIKGNHPRNPRLEERAQERCLWEERRANEQIWDAELNSMPAATRTAIMRYSQYTLGKSQYAFYYDAREAGRSKEDIMAEFAQAAVEAEPARKPRFKIRIR